MIFNKTTNRMLLAFGTIAVVLLTSCTKQNVSTPYVDQGLVYFTGDATATQLVPAGTSTGTGKFVGVYDANSQIFNYKVSWYGLSSTMAAANFFGPALAGQTGIVTRSITSAQTRPATDSLTGVIWTYSKLTDTELADLKAGKWYYTITTANNASGEVRGQITLKK